MALDLFAPQPALLSLHEAVEAHRRPGLTLMRTGRHGFCGQLELTEGAGGRSLVTEILRLAAVGRGALATHSLSPQIDLGGFVRTARIADEELLITLEGR